MPMRAYFEKMKGHTIDGRLRNLVADCRSNICSASWTLPTMQRSTGPSPCMLRQLHETLQQY